MWHVANLCCDSAYKISGISVSNVWFVWLLPRARILQRFTLLVIGQLSLVDKGDPSRSFFVTLTGWQNNGRQKLKSYRAPITISNRPLFNFRNTPKDFEYCYDYSYFYSSSYQYSFIIITNIYSYCWYYEYQYNDQYRYNTCCTN